MSEPEPHRESWLEKPDTYAPGSYGCHEVLHMTAFLEHAVDTELVQHTAIQRDSSFLLEAERALSALSRLYQLIGAKHLT